MPSQEAYVQQGLGTFPPGTTQYVVQQSGVFPTQPYTQQQPHTIIIAQPTYVPGLHVYQTYKAKVAKILGSLHLAVGILSFIVTIGGITLNVSDGRTGIPEENWTFYVAPGIWCALLVSACIMLDTNTFMILILGQTYTLNISNIPPGWGHSRRGGVGVDLVQETGEGSSRGQILGQNRTDSDIQEHIPKVLTSGLENISTGLLVHMTVIVFSTTHILLCFVLQLEKIPRTN